MTLQGREITKDNIELVQRLIEANPSEESHLAFPRVVPSVGLACCLARLKTWPAAPFFRN